MMKKEKINLTVTISSEIYKKINEGGYNGNKLVNQLLSKYLEKKAK